jgi:hypothetical protein
MLQWSFLYKMAQWHDGAMPMEGQDRWAMGAIDADREV